MSGLSRNIGAASRERDRRRRITATEDPFYMPVSMSPEYDAMYGTIHDLQDAGYGVNVYGSLARPAFDDYGGGGLNPFERESLKNQAISRESDLEAQRRRLQDQFQTAGADARQRQLIGELQTSQDRQAIDTALSAPNRELALQRLPGHLKPYYEQMWADQDLAQRKMTLEEDKVRAAGDRDTSALVAIMGPNGQSILVPRQMAIGQRPASAREQGRPVTSGDAGRVADYDTSLDDLTTLRDTLTQTATATGTGAKIGASLPNVLTDAFGWGTEAKQRQSVIDRVKQVIGKALEGGVLRKEDEYKYEKILPTIGDTQAVAASKLNGLEQAIRQRRSTQIDALEDAGYEVGRFRERAPHGAATGTVKLTSPDGSETIDVPPDQVEHYLKLGAKRAGG